MALQSLQWTMQMNKSLYCTPVHRACHISSMFIMDGLINKRHLAVMRGECSQTVTVEAALIRCFSDYSQQSGMPQENGLYYYYVMHSSLAAQMCYNLWLLGLFTTFTIISPVDSRLVHSITFAGFIKSNQTFFGESVKLEGEFQFAKSNFTSFCIQKN